MTNPTDTVSLTDEVEIEVNGQVVDQDNLPEFNDDELPDVDGEVVDDSTEDEKPAKKSRTPRKSQAAKNSDKAAGKAVEKAAKPSKKEVETSEFTKAKAKSMTDQIRKGLEHSVELLITAYQGRIWLALGHASWQEYLDDELGDLRPKFPVDERRQLVAEMTKNGMTQRPIAKALGVDQSTVKADLDVLTTEGVIVTDSVRVGEDGREVSNAPREPREESQEKKEAKFQKAADKALDKLDGAVGDLTELMSHELFEELAGTLANRARPELARALASLETFLEAIQ